MSSISCDIVAEAYFFPYEYSVIPEPFAEETFLSQLNYFGTFVENQVKEISASA